MVTFKDISEREAHILIAALEVVSPCGGWSPQFGLLGKLKSQFEVDPAIHQTWLERHCKTFIDEAKEQGVI